MSKAKTHILVTGASRGIGKAILESLDRDDVTVVGQSTGGGDGLAFLGMGMNAAGGAVHEDGRRSFAGSADPCDDGPDPGVHDDPAQPERRLVLVARVHGRGSQRGASRLAEAPPRRSGSAQKRLGASCAGTSASPSRP